MCHLNAINYKMSCNKRSCNNDALYGEPNSKKPRYCKKHKKDGNVVIKLKKIVNSNTESENDIEVGLIIEKNIPIIK
jgi:hypothetical protein